MSSTDLSVRQNLIFRECLNAVVNGPFIPNCEFSIVFGLEKYEVAFVLNQWDRIDKNDCAVKLAINNTLNNLLGYPIVHREQWSAFISISEEELHDMFDEWTSRHQ
jgi:hypothetical protein